MINIKFQPLLTYLSSDKVLLFILWPFGALLRSLLFFRNPQSKTLFWVFCIYFGFVFIYEDPSLDKFGADSATYAAKLIELHNQPISIKTLASSFYNANEGTVDIYQPLVTWVLSAITGDPRILFAVFAAVFGFYYSQNLWMVFNTINKKVGLILLLFMLTYAFVNPIWNINGVRMWTAAQIFLFGNLKYFLHNDKKGVLWSATSILVHFSFMFPVAIFILWIFLPKKEYLFISFYVFTVFFVEMDLGNLANYLNFMPNVFQPRIEGYTNEGYAEMINQTSQMAAFHVKLSEIVIRWLTHMWIIAFFVKRENWTREIPNLRLLYTFALLIGGFANIATQVPSGARFQVIAHGLLFGLFVIVMGQHKIRLNLNWLKQISIPLLSYAIIFKLRLGMDFIGILTLFGNPLIAPFLKIQIPLIDFIKQIL